MAQHANSTHGIDALALLSADHKEVKASFKKFEELGDRAYATKKKLADSICDALTIHTLVEEEIFYPAVRKAFKEASDMVDEALVEHASAKELIAQLKEMEAEDELFDAKVKVLSGQIDHHVEEEEGEMFPKLGKTNLDLLALGAEIEARKKQLEEEGPATFALLHGSTKTATPAGQGKRI